MLKYPEPTVGAVIFNPEDKILLCQSHKWDNQYVIPGGHIELGEPMEEALKREIWEETGLEIYDIQLISLKESIFSDKFYKKKHFIFIDFMCKTDSSKVTLDNEAEDYKWVALEDIDDLPLGGFTKDLLLEIRNKDKSHWKAEIFYKY